MVVDVQINCIGCWARYAWYDPGRMGIRVSIKARSKISARLIESPGFMRSKHSR